jgi:hypothetical protein
MNSVYSWDSSCNLVWHAMLYDCRVFFPLKQYIILHTLFQYVLVPTFGIIPSVVSHKSDFVPSSYSYITCTLLCFSRNFSSRQFQQLLLPPLLQQLLPHLRPIPLTPFTLLRHLPEFQLLLLRGLNLLDIDRFHERVEDLGLLHVADVERVCGLRGIRNERGLRIGRGCGCECGLRGGLGGLRARVDVEERGAVWVVVAGYGDGNGGVAVFYPGKHLSPEFSALTS